MEATSFNIPLPTKFDTEATLGVEVSPFIGEAADTGTIEIQLRDKK